MTGKVKTYNDDKGFGFIIPEGKQPREDDKFFHVTQCLDGYRPAPGDAVTFEEGIGRNNQTCALKVALAE